MNSYGTTISPARWPEDREVIVRLFREYQDWLAEAVCFHDFEVELNNLPGDYSEPSGCLLIARNGDEVLGVVGVTPYDKEENACELKRLYVLPAARGQGIGRSLSVAILDYAHKTGYGCIRLETLKRLEAARAIYADLGFCDMGNRTEGDHESPMVMALNLA
jgi:ribosomal protein S18 acetylase RimI-like enzyme